MGGLPPAALLACYRHGHMGKGPEGRNRKPLPAASPSSAQDDLGARLTAVLRAIPAGFRIEARPQSDLVPANTHGLLYAVDERTGVEVMLRAFKLRASPEATLREIAASLEETLPGAVSERLAGTAARRELLVTLREVVSEIAPGADAELASIGHRMDFYPDPRSAVGSVDISFGLWFRVGVVPSDPYAPRGRFFRDVHGLAPDLSRAEVDRVVRTAVAALLTEVRDRFAAQASRTEAVARARTVAEAAIAAEAPLLPEGYRIACEFPEPIPSDPWFGTLYFTHPEHFTHPEPAYAVPTNGHLRSFEESEITPERIRSAVADLAANAREHSVRTARAARHEAQLRDLLNGLGDLRKNVQADPMDTGSTVLVHHWHGEGYVRGERNCATRIDLTEEDDVFAEQVSRLIAHVTTYTNGTSDQLAERDARFAFIGAELDRLHRDPDAALSPEALAPRRRKRAKPAADAGPSAVGS